jgi:hypothetical protein
MRRLVALVVVLGGCAQLRDDMRLAEDAFDQAHYDHALVWLNDLEDDTPAMTMDQRSTFFYLRGMTAYRLNHRADALHYLALAREVSGEEGLGTLRPEWRTQMDRTLEELTPRDASYRPRTTPTELE